MTYVATKRNEAQRSIWTFSEAIKKGKGGLFETPLVLKSEGAVPSLVYFTVGQSRPLCLVDKLFICSMLMQMLCHNCNMMLNYLIYNDKYNITAFVATSANFSTKAINVG